MSRRSFEVFLKKIKREELLVENAIKISSEYETKVSYEVETKHTIGVTYFI